MNKTSSAVRTYILQDISNTVPTESALKTTNACLGGGRWQIFVTVFAVRAQLEHGLAFSVDEQGKSQNSILMRSVILFY